PAPLWLRLGCLRDGPPPPHPPSQGFFPPAAAETKAEAGEDGGAWPRQFPCPPRLEHRPEDGLKESPAAGARGAHARPQATAVLSSLPYPPLPSSPPPASAAAGGRTLSDQPREPRSIPI
ncbi:hypothetical protein H1C71_030368, partial [Ictidomys tridecemlineatus]